METEPTVHKTEERLPWHKPAVERLTVALETQADGDFQAVKRGSLADGDFVNGRPSSVIV